MSVSRWCRVWTTLGDRLEAARDAAIREKESPTQWRLWLFADQKYVNDPSGARTFRSMANRYMNIDNLPVVSRLIERPIAFSLKIILIM